MTALLTTLQVKVFVWSPFGDQTFWFMETFLQIKSPASKFKAPWQLKWSQLGGLPYTDGHRHLFNSDTLVKRTPRVGPCLSYSLNLPVYKADLTLRWTFGAGPKVLCLWELSVLLLRSRVLPRGHLTITDTLIIWTVAYEFPRSQTCVAKEKNSCLQGCLQ